MNENNLYSHEGFKYGIIGLGLIIILIVLIQLMGSSMSDTNSILIGIVTFSLGIISIIGCVKSLKGIKEPNTTKKVIGILINLGILLLFLFAIMANIYDFYKAFVV